MKKINGTTKIWALLGLMWIVVTAYIIFASTMPLWADGWFYHVYQPLPVTAVHAENPGTVTLFWARVTRRPMRGYCVTKLLCANGGVRVMDGECSIEGDYEEFHWQYAVPSNFEGPCTVEGGVSYRPLGIGPAIWYSWKSEPFNPRVAVKYAVDRLGIRQSLGINTRTLRD